MEIVSPGGFPSGIGPENILQEQNPRNSRIADVLGKCGLVERAGQGVDFIFRGGEWHLKREFAPYWCAITL
ncbi:MAG: hypothetical protein HOP18_10735 [Deltaproteobacteria bacterium]|nr:hypothetical protein [Deltaproteobacteria bacterium]